MAEVYVSPAEPANIRAHFITSSGPEELGIDFMWSTGKTLWGVQRKAFPADFLASLRDDRLGKELGQMQSIDVAVLILEGVPRWVRSGNDLVLYGERTRFSENQLFSILASLEVIHGVKVFWSDSHDQTIRIVKRLAQWSVTNVDTTPLTSSLRKHNKPPKSDWGTRDSKDWTSWILQAFPHIGPKVANAIIEFFGYLPLTWTVTEDELLQVPGVGKTIARRLIDTLDESYMEKK